MILTTTSRSKKREIVTLRELIARLEKRQPKQVGASGLFLMGLCFIFLKTKEAQEKQDRRRIDLVNRKFESANDVDVERVTIRRNEWFTQN